MTVSTDRLAALLEEAAEGAIAVDRADVGPDSIRRLGPDSKTMLAFMVAVEDEFGFEWDADVPAAAIASFSGLATYIAGRCPR